MERSDIEDIFVNFLLTLDKDLLKKIKYQEDIFENLSYDDEEEIKHELYRIAIGSINFSDIIQKLKEDLPESEEE
jgi:hypothetical protein